MGEPGRCSLAADEELFLPTRWLWPVQRVTDYPNRLVNQWEREVREGDGEEMEGVIRGTKVQLVPMLDELWGRGWGTGKRYRLFLIMRLIVGMLGADM
jgi:hypothetical protein